MKGNHGQVHDLVAEWVALDDVDKRPPDDIRVDKAHGRLERRELWVVPAGEMTAYLQDEFGWEQVQLMGQIRRYRRRVHLDRWESVKTTLWIAGAKICLCFHRPNCKRICANIGRLKIGSSTSGMSVLMKTVCMAAKSVSLFPLYAMLRSISFVIWASGLFLMPVVPFPPTPIPASPTSSVHLH